MLYSRFGSSPNTIKTRKWYSLLKSSEVLSMNETKPSQNDIIVNDTGEAKVFESFGNCLTPLKRKWEVTESWRKTQINSHQNLYQLKKDESALELIKVGKSWLKLTSTLIKFVPTKMHESAWELMRVGSQSPARFAAIINLHQLLLSFDRGLRNPQSPTDKRTQIV